MVKSRSLNILLVSNFINFTGGPRMKNLWVNLFSYPHLHKLTIVSYSSTTKKISKIIAESI